MITLSRKLKKENVEVKENCDMTKRISIRDRLLVKEIQEMENTLPTTCRTSFSDPNILYEFVLCICPDEGFWKGGTYKFIINVPEEYNMVPPNVKCLTKLWHPNISVSGDICLSLLRQNSIDGLGWAPTRKIKDVIWGLNSLFTDLLNFDDPLNSEAAEQYQRDQKEFQTKVKEYVLLYASR